MLADVSITSAVAGPLAAGSVSCGRASASTTRDATSSCNKRSRLRSSRRTGMWARRSWRARCHSSTELIGTSCRRARSMYRRTITGSTARSHNAAGSPSCIRYITARTANAGPDRQIESRAVIRFEIRVKSLQQASKTQVPQDQVLERNRRRRPHIVDLMPQAELLQPGQKGIARPCVRLEGRTVHTDLHRLLRLGVNQPRVAPNGRHELVVAEDVDDEGVKVMIPGQLEPLFVAIRIEEVTDDEQQTPPLRLVHVLPHRLARAGAAFARRCGSTCTRRSGGGCWSFLVTPSNRVGIEEGPNWPRIIT